MKLIPSTKLLLPCLQPLNSFQEFSRVAKIATDMKTPIDMKDMKIDTEEMLEVFRRFWKGWDRTSCPSSLSGQTVFLPCSPGTHPKVKKCRDFSPQKDEKFLIPPHQSLSPHALNTHGSALPALGLFFFFGEVSLSSTISHREGERRRILNKPRAVTPLPLAFLSPVLTLLNTGSLQRGNRG